MPSRDLRFFFLFIIGAFTNKPVIFIEHVIFIFLLAAMDISSDLTEHGKTQVAVIFVVESFMLLLRRPLSFFF